MMFRIFFILFSLTELMFSQRVQNSFRIFPSSVTQTEPVIAISKSNPPLFFASGVTINTSNVFRSEGVYVSTNEGISWFGSDTCKGQLILNHGGDPGIAITANNRLILTHIGSIFPGVYSHYSTDIGLTWSNAFTITNQQTDDKGSTLIDDNSSSPYFGRIYSSFVKIVSPYPVYISHSVNGGESWANPTVINNQPPARCMGPALVISKDGKIFASWASITPQSPFLEDYINFAVSTNGGDSWAVTNNIFDVNGITGTLPEKSNIRVNGLPRMAIDKSNRSRDGWLYIVTTERNNFPAGTDPDIILRRSSDSGLTWSNGIRVNQDNLNNGKIQYFPAIEIDEYGNVNIIYYDDRNTSSDSAEVILSRSTNGGDSWIEEVISDHRFKPKPVLGGSSNYQGDYISLISNNQKLYALWMDDFSGIYQIWMKILDVLPTDLNENISTKPIFFNLHQNYPNPFNPATTISWQSPVSAWHSLKVYDLLGNEISTLVNEWKEAGSHFVQFNADGLSSGIYYYKLIADKFSESKAMIFLK